MTSVQAYNEPLGPPMPRYFARILEVRIDGAVVQDADAIAPASKLTFDLEVYGERNTLRLEDKQSVLPPPANDIDVNCTQHRDKWIDVGYVPGLRLFLPFVPYPEDNILCEDTGGGG